MRKLTSVIFCTLLLCGCTATQELQKAREHQSRTTVYYSPVNGEVYRLQPREQELPESARAMPRLLVPSYSPLRPDPDFVAINEGRKGPARSAPTTRPANKPAVSYSPLTGEAVYLAPKS
ncbi:MAG: hypothetical protein K1X83_00870 [Oligoflexia bacterium]|nr:hypothetical protein [Oligoflexia bacterium]